STLALYRRALALRRSKPGLAGEAFRWLASPGSVLFFERGPGLCCAVNLGERPWTPPAGGRVLLSSAPLEGDAILGDEPWSPPASGRVLVASAPLEGEGAIPPDGAAWLAVSPSP
ncbi:MAG TPA: DUF3459 domain-containing protein, partial [Solirubrobacteraceae bacterium]|nr:DUF3459 domain-containing protein [Solirubrobacteraceae bacterium]